MLIFKMVHQCKHGHACTSTLCIDNGFLKSVAYP